MDERDDTIEPTAEDDANPYSAPDEEGDPAAPRRRRRRRRNPYETIGGLLVLVAIGQVLSPLILGISTWLTFRPIFTTGNYEAFTTPGGEHYHPMWGTLIWYEIVSNGFLCCLLLVQIPFFFARKRAFRVIYTATFVIAVLLAGVDILLAMQLPIFKEQGTFPVDHKALLHTAVWFVWVLYILRSERSRRTFVR